MVSCASCGCSQTTKNKTLKITFHSFPKDLQRRKAWIDFMKKPEWEPKPSNVLCSLHFADKCFDRSSQLKMRLRPTAIPTIDVDRLKYVRTYNPVHRRPVEDEKNKIMEGEHLAEPILLEVKQERTPSPVYSNPLPQNTSLENVLNRKISELYKKDILKSQKIRRLQKIVWQQKKQILSLKSTVQMLKKST